MELTFIDKFPTFILACIQMFTTLWTSFNLFGKPDNLLNKRPYKDVTLASKQLHSSHSSAMVSLLTVVLIVSLTVASTQTSQLASCSCWDGYEAYKSSEGVKCFGKLVLDTMPCNIPRRPDCKCNNVDAILVNSDGIWCTKYNPKMKASRKWPCENQDEWKSFNKEN